MTSSAGERTKFKSRGKIDWIYWIEADQWNNALVLNDNSGYVSNSLKLYFNNVYSVLANNPYEFQKIFDDISLKEMQFDLIFCTDLFHELRVDRKNAKAVLDRFHLNLSERGNLIFGYMRGWNILKYTIDKTLNNNIFKNYHEYPEIKKRKVTADVYYRNLMKNKDFKIIRSLFSFPSHEYPWTISNSKIFGKGVRDWKRKNRRNSLIFRFMSSKITSWLCRYWWPYRILIIGKQDEHNRHDQRGNK